MNCNAVETNLFGVGRTPAISANDIGNIRIAHRTRGLGDPRGHILRGHRAATLRWAPQARGTARGGVSEIARPVYAHRPHVPKLRKDHAPRKMHGIDDALPPRQGVLAMQPRYIALVGSSPAERRWMIDSHAFCDDQAD